MRIGTLLLAVSVALLAGQSPAATFSTMNGVRASGSALEFEVFGTSVGSELFCAAGDFARWRLSARSNDRVVLIRGFGPSPNFPGQRSASFTLAGPEARTDWGGGVILRGNRGVGQNRTVGHAVFLCNQQ